MWGKIKIRLSDKLFSQYIRKKNNYICEFCKRFFSEGKGLQASHFFSRRYENIRFDPENVSCFCISCHKYFHENRKDYVSWKLKKLGKKEYDLLEIRKNLYKKRDDFMDKLKIKELLKTL